MNVIAEIAQKVRKAFAVSLSQSKSIAISRVVRSEWEVLTLLEVVTLLEAVTYLKTATL